MSDFSLCVRNTYSVHVIFIAFIIDLSMTSDDIPFSFFF